jgi:hypothetical protein
MVFTLVIGLVATVALASVGAAIAATPPSLARSAHGSVRLLRVIDGGRADRLPLQPDALDRFSGAFAVDDNETLYLSERARAQVFVYDDACLDAILTPADEHVPAATRPTRTSPDTLALGEDARGFRYDAAASDAGWTVDRRDGDGLIATVVVDSRIDVWDWYVRDDGAVFAIAWRDCGSAWRLSLYSVLGAPRS